MKILLTGANGYIGKRILPVLLDLGHEVYCCVRNKNRAQFLAQYSSAAVHYVEIDFLEDNVAEKLPKDIDLAYYLIHSMSSSTEAFDAMERTMAENFVKGLKQTAVKQVIYLGGIANEESLSKHLNSRMFTEEVLRQGKFSLTVLRAGIIVGSGSASFEIIRDLVEKLPIMITPKWAKTKCQPIGVRDVIKFLTGVIAHPACMNKTFDIGGTEVLSYKDMLLVYAEVRKLWRKIWIVPVLTPKLSSHWLYFVCATNYKLAVNLVDSMMIEVVCKNNDLQQILNIEPLSYREAIRLAFQRIEDKEIISSWKDSYASSTFAGAPSRELEIPTFGCFKDAQRLPIAEADRQRVLANVWSIGGERGWYYGNWLWRIRGFLDKLVGGVGLRRGRTHPSVLNTGDSLDFWRVLLADKEKERLVLFAEMKTPGEAWLEFRITHTAGQLYLLQTATFRPKGLAGRLYWFASFPFHLFIFSGLIKNLVRFSK